MQKLQKKNNMLKFKELLIVKSKRWEKKKIKSKIFYQVCKKKIKKKKRFFQLLKNPFFRKKLTTYRRIRNCLKKKGFFFRHFFYKNEFYKNISNKEYVHLFFYLGISSNNIFCLLKNKQKILKTCSAGKFNVNVTKKNLKFSLKTVLTFFLLEIKNDVSNLEKKTLFFFIRCPLRFRKFILKIIFPKILKTRVKFKQLFFQLNVKKCFNGCKVKKIKRKKTKKKRLLK